MTTTLVAPFRVFVVQVRATQALSPTFRRITFTGVDLDGFADNGYDQRIKLVVPLPGTGVATLPRSSDWYAEWRDLPDAERNPIRTYTVRAVRPELHEVDVDVALHGDLGPASRWAAAVAVGDTAALVGPDRAYDGVQGGIEFRLPGPGTPLLLAGDETAVPAICSILERLPADVRGEALLEVPHPDDVLPLVAPPGMRVRWLPRAGQPHGSRLVPEVQLAAARLLGRTGATAASGAGVVDLRPGQPPSDGLADEDLLWEVSPEGGAGAPLYAWLAGEAGVICSLRRHLVSELGVDRRAVAFMGYWKQGRSEN